MFEIREPYKHLSVAIEGNIYFDWAREKGVIIIDFKEIDGKKWPIVNNRQLEWYEWKIEMGAYRITLKDWA